MGMERVEGPHEGRHHPKAMCTGRREEDTHGKRHPLTKTTGVNVLVFSVLRERIGSSSVPMEIGQPLTVGALLERLGESHPAIRAFLPVVRVAVNQEYAHVDRMVQAGDEVALITPVSGG